MPNNALNSQHTEQHQPHHGDGAEADPELQELRRRVAERQADCRKLEALISKADVQKDATARAFEAGVGAARAQMHKLKSELTALRNPSGTSASDVDGEPAPVLANLQLDHNALDDAKNRLKAMDVDVRAHRHELARWRHQVELIESERPKQEDHIVKLKTNLTHTLDVLDSTRNTMRHLEVERELRRAPAQTIEADKDAAFKPIPLLGGGHASIEAYAERNVREKTEARNLSMQAKIQQLSETTSAQHLLLQRLEKQLALQGGALEEKEMQLAGERQCQQRLKGAMRRRSDEAVAKALGMALP